MRKPSHIISSGVSIIETVIFLAFTLIQYYAFCIGLAPFVMPRFGFWPIVAIVFFTYMFRLDIVAALIGFYGMWKIWHWPLPAAVVVSVLFMIMSLSINYGIKTGMRHRWFRNRWSAENTEPVITKEQGDDR